MYYKQVASHYAVKTCAVLKHKVSSGAKYADSCKKREVKEHAYGPRISQSPPFLPGLKPFLIAVHSECHFVPITVHLATCHWWQHDLLYIC